MLPGWVTEHFNLIRAVVLVVVSIGVTLVVSIAIINSANHAQEEAELRSCHRLNILRANDNRNWLRAYKILHGTTDLRLKTYANQLQWVPLTNCPQAVYTNARAPKPVSFGRALPPKSARHLGPTN